MKLIKYVPADATARAENREATMAIRVTFNPRTGNELGHRRALPHEADKIAAAKGWKRLSGLSAKEKELYRGKKFTEA